MKYSPSHINLDKYQTKILFLLIAITCSIFPLDLESQEKGGNPTRLGVNPDSSEVRNLEKEADPKKIQWNSTVFADLYYARTNPTPPDNRRPYVTQSVYTNEMQLNHGLFHVEGENEKVRFGLGGHTGSYVEANYAGEPEQYQYIYEARVGVNLWKDLWLDAGIFPSHIGMESAMSIDNQTYTRSLMAENSPYYESGAKLSWEGFENWTFSVLALNGWQKIRNTNNDMALGTQVEYSKNGFTFNYSTFIGNEAPSEERRQTRYFQNFFIAWEPDEKWEIRAAFDIGFQAKNYDSWFQRLENQDINLINRQTRDTGMFRWYTNALIVSYWITPEFRIAGRVEYFHDPRQLIVQTDSPNGYQVTSGSVNFDYFITKNTALRFEYRTFSSMDLIFARDEGNPANFENLAVVSIAGRL